METTNRLTQFNEQVKLALLESNPDLQADWDEGYTETLEYFQELIGKLNVIYQISGFKLCINPSFKKDEILDEISIIQFDSDDWEEPEGRILTQINKIDIQISRYFGDGIDTASWHRSYGTDTLVLTSSF